MSVRLRILFFDDDGIVRRIPLRRYSDLRRTGPRNTLPEYAGKVVRCAEVAVEVQDRKPLRIVHVTFPLLVFDAKGRVDEDVQDAGARLAVESLADVVADEHEREEAARHSRVAVNRFKQEFCWSPSAEEQALIEHWALQR